MTWVNRLAPVLAVAVLCGIVMVAMARPAPADAEPYHARVRAAVAAAPRELDGWLSRDQEVPPAAVKLLKPNALLSRVYEDPKGGGQVTFVIVHTKDARDMIGHYPPNCYPNSGYTLEGSSAKTWAVGGQTMTGTEYAFSLARPTGVERMVVDNLLILPDGRYAKNMREVIDLASDYTRHFFGAAQIQVITPASLSDEERDGVFAKVLGANLPLIEALGSAEKG